MKSFPFYLLCVGTAAAIIASVFCARALSAAILLVYIAGFLGGIAFGSDGTDPGGGRIDSGWMIWGGVFLAFLLIGATVELARRGRRKPNG